jgi:oligoribonuclease NrnB/cAMP/cGMP phosphodiesterase (DHH superfamily)
MHPKDELLTAANRELISGRNIVLVDISFSASVMVEAATLARKIVVLDHHLTNQAELQSLDVPNMRIVFEQDVAGCRLAWRFLNGGHEIHLPRAFYYIGLKDVWQHKTNENALYFTTAFQKPATLEDWRDYRFCTPKTDEVIEEGRHIYRYQQSVLGKLL